VIAALALLAVATTVVGLVRLSDDGAPDDGEVSSSTLPAEPATSSSASPSITSTPATTTVITTTTVTTTTVTTTSASADGASTTSAPPVGATPNSVSRLSAGSGGGSGEVVVRWGTVVGAIGYRVLHAATVHGPFSIAADVNVQTGKTSAVEGVTNIWSNRWTYHPPALASSSFDGVPDELETSS
jgi:hypothetical protein